MNLALALDNSFEIMNEDEMYDVNGGIYISNGTLKSIFAGLTTISTAILYTVGWTIKIFASALLSSIPVHGLIFAGFLFGADVYEIGSTVVESLTNNKGLEIGLNFKKFFRITYPRGLTFTAK